MKVSTLAAAAVAASPSVVAAAATWPAAQNQTIQYAPVPGVFVQDDASTDASAFDYANANFGLINRTYPFEAESETSCSDSDGDELSQWQKFAQFVEYLNSASCRRSTRETTRYKVLFMGRHGEGWHNAAETFYGTPAWNCYWAEQTGNGTASWDDPTLTPAGIAQAVKANAYFRDRYAAPHSMPHFDAYYVSPLTRCTTTANMTFGDLEIPSGSAPFVPIIKESLREGMTPQTCNRRSSKTYIHNMFPSFVFEDGFSELDQSWHANEAETDDAELARARQALDDIFRLGDDDAVWVSITAHSGLITKLLKALGHRSFKLSTGQIIPVLVKATLKDTTPTHAVEAYEPYSTCSAPPISSDSAKGCICSSATTLATAMPTA